MVAEIKIKLKHLARPPKTCQAKCGWKEGGRKAVEGIKNKTKT